MGTQSDCLLTGPDFLYSDKREWLKEPSVKSEEISEVRSLVGARTCRPANETPKDVSVLFKAA